MREIKFRVWYQGKMHSLGDIYEAYFIDGAYLEHSGHTGDKPAFMQYTGIRDKNGAEIYEGDIVVIRDYDDGDYYMAGSVKYGVNGYPAFDIYDKNGGVYSDEYNTLSNDGLVFEIIGNIYENPELLK